MRINPVLIKDARARWFVYLAALAIAWPLWQRAADARDPLNGFDLTGSTLPAGQIIAGGPPRDGIPAIDHPRFIAGAKVVFLAPGDRVLGLSMMGQQRAYPVRILNSHGIVNDVVAEQPVVVTYCPLCGSGVAFSARTGGRALRFGVSGLLYNSDVLLYDRATESLWSQLLGRAVSGPLSGSELRQIPLVHTTWSAWRRQYPHSHVLSPASSARQRDYGRDPYRGYGQCADIYFPLSHRDDRLPAKTWVAGLALAGHYRAYPLQSMADWFSRDQTTRHRDVQTVTDTLAGRCIELRYDPLGRSLSGVDDRGNGLPMVTLYWFAWAAFHPDTDVWRAPQD